MTKENVPFHEAVQCVVAKKSIPSHEAAKKVSSTPQPGRSYSQAVSSPASTVLPCNPQQRKSASTQTVQVESIGVQLGGSRLDACEAGTETESPLTKHSSFQTEWSEYEFWRHKKTYLTKLKYRKKQIYEEESECPIYIPIFEEDTGTDTSDDDMEDKDEEEEEEEDIPSQTSATIRRGDPRKQIHISPVKPP